MLSFFAALLPFGDDGQLVRFRRFLLMFMLGSFVLSFGRFLPGFVGAVSHVPVLRARSGTRSSSWRAPSCPITLLCGIALPVGGKVTKAFVGFVHSGRVGALGDHGTLLGLIVLGSHRWGSGSGFSSSSSERRGRRSRRGLTPFDASRRRIWAAAVLVLFHRRLRPSAWQP